LIDVRLAGRNRRRVGLAAGIAALSALRLRQDGLDLLDQRVALDLELDRGEAECRAEDDGAQGHDRQAR
jgi:hypothetical protein